MSVNFGAGPAPTPNIPNAADAPPPQPVAPPDAQHNRPPNAPTMGATAPAASPLEPAVVGDTIANSTQPTLNARQALSFHITKLREDWVRVEQAIKTGDLKLVHHLLDEGLVPCVVEEDDSGKTVYTSFPDNVFRHLLDIDLFDRFIDLFTRHSMQAVLYHHTIQVGNGILLRRLVQSSVDGWQGVPSQLASLIAYAIIQGDAKQLDAVIQIKKESFSMIGLDWNDIWSHVSRSPKKFLNTDAVATLVKNLKPSQFSKQHLVEMFCRVADQGENSAVSCLVDWLGDDLSEFAVCDEWRYVRGRLTLEMFSTLAKGGFPLQGMHLPSASHQQAQEFQLVLFGPELSRSPIAKMLNATEHSSVSVIDFVFTCAFGQCKDRSPNLLPPGATRLRPDQIANALFQNGVALPLAIKLSQTMSQYLKLIEYNYISGGHRLGFLAYLNECVQPDAIDPFQDPLSVEQAKIIGTHLFTALEQQFGDPIGFFARALACIATDGSIDTFTLGLIYGQRMGLPKTMVAQIESTLEAAAAEVMASAVPLNLIKPGMTGVELMSAFHGWIQKSVARLLITRLPQALGLNIAHVEQDDSSKGSVDVDDVKDTKDAADAKAAEAAEAALLSSELEAPVRYLATSVISQYARLLTEDVETNTAIMLEVSRALPADGFKLTKDDYVSSSDDEEVSASEEASVASSEQEESSSADN